MWIISKMLNNRNIRKMNEAGERLNDLEANGQGPGDKEYEEVTLEFLGRSLKVRKHVMKGLSR